jgi:hypothetical protein
MMSILFLIITLTIRGSPCHESGWGSLDPSSVRALSEPSDPRFTDEDAARAYLKKVQRPDGAVRPRCVGVGRVTKCEGPRSATAGLAAASSR